MRCCRLQEPRDLQDEARFGRYLSTSTLDKLGLHERLPGHKHAASSCAPFVAGVFPWEMDVRRRPSLWPSTNAAFAQVEQRVLGSAIVSDVWLSNLSASSLCTGPPRFRRPMWRGMVVGFPWRWTWSRMYRPLCHAKQDPWRPAVTRAC
ncbi:hypothetical protein H310_03485 [Aphanomyces invadans]|uniref:Uncharacterized protein n=1 Tax=Aphanomyces invadans TaxID=157072 RepID=A0A024UHN2_9STRA|nr:hypothetical protein H310_03485 [Aphanomyces invadans]ETW05804.1 hypothetical protein H310_03485 [Aphanomyces invadans]|eukprot:XP_008865581.1 hypothetical protein H310_03485 [Aphanomyces invadans]